MSALRPSPRILGIGNPLLDISAVVPLELLERFGLALNNAVLAEEKHLPLYEELVEKYEVEYIAGGATQNSIRVAQWMSGKAGSTAYIGCVGKDEYGRKLREAAEADGVEVHYMEVDDTPTGTCAVLIHGGERSLVANLAAANKYSEEHLTEDDVSSVIGAAELVYIGGFFLTVSPPSILHVAKRCADEHKLLAMNLSAPFLCEFFREPMMAALPYTDLIFCNESEAAKFGEVHGVEGDVAAVARHIARLPKSSADRPRTVVITQGSASTLVVVGEDEPRLFPVEPLEKEKLVDTNGAGDAFVGGYLAKLADGEDLAACVEAGHFAARTIIQRSGCSIPRE